MIHIVQPDRDYLGWIGDRRHEFDRIEAFATCSIRDGILSSSHSRVTEFEKITHIAGQLTARGLVQVDHPVIKDCTYLGRIVFGSIGDEFHSSPG